MVEMIQNLPHLDEIDHSPVTEVRWGESELTELTPIHNKELEEVLLKAVTENTPMVNTLIKRDLRNKIQRGRVSKGLDELKVEYTPPPSYQMRPEEIRKMEKRKARNRTSAKISRERRKAKERILTEIVKKLEEEHSKRQKQVADLRKMEEKMRTRFANHLLRCNSLLAIPPAQQDRSVPG